ncbi:MAG: hypothetical protein AAF830_07195 [Pseudomonadota bacterium]
MFRVFLAPISLLLLAACASSGTYGPASGGGFGYTQQAIEDNRYRVTFKARDASEAEDGALRRAAEITVEQGFDHFTVVSRDLAREQRGPNSSVGIGGGSIGRRSGVGVGVSVPLGGTNETVTARLEIVMGRGEKPEGPRSYRARGILSNLGASAE